MSAPATARDRRTILGAVAARMGRDTALFAGSSAAGLFLGLVTAIVLTHYMAPAEYGRLALMLVVSSLLTTLYNLGSLQGVLMTVFSGGDDEGAVVEPGDHGPVVTDRRGALTTGLAATAAVAVTGAIVVAAAADPLSELVTGGGGARPELVLAAVAGGLGAVWRLAVNVVRMERRAWTFVALQLLRPVAVIAISVPLVAGAGTAVHALEGLAAGTAIGLAATLALSARSYAPRLLPAAVPRIFGAGAPYIPLSLAFWAVHTLDVLIVSAFASDARTGEYRLGSRVGALVSYFTSAFFMTWAPITRTTAWAAAERRDSAGVRRLLVSSFVLVTVWLVLAASLCAGLLVRLAPPAYAEAAPIVPLVALGWAFYALFVLVYRAAELAGKRRVYVRLAIAAAVIFALAGSLLTALAGPAGAALGNVVAFAIVTAILLAVIRARGGNVPLDTARLLRVVAVAAVCWALGLAAGPLPDGWQALVVVALLAAYPVALLALGVVPARHVRALAVALRAELQPRAAVEAVQARARTLDPARTEALRTGLRGAPADPASRLALVAALRELAEAGPPTPHDAAIADYLLLDAAVAERDAAARALYEQGADPGDVLLLETALARLRQGRRGRRPRARSGRATSD